MATKRKRIKVEAGQVVAVPLLDGTFALCHVAVFDGEIIAMLFAVRVKRAEQLLQLLNETLNNAPIARMTITANRVQDGEWPVIAVKTPTYAAEMLDNAGWSCTASLTPMLFEAYYGLRPWDEMADPKHWEKSLLPGVPVPPTVRFKRDFEADAAASAVPATAATATEAPDAPIAEGPAVIHIEMTYPGDELPSIELLHRRQALERALEAAGAGEVTDAGGGGGVMDIFLETDDVARSIPLVRAVLGASELGKTARVETAPLDE